MTEFIEIFDPDFERLMKRCSLRIIDEHIQKSFATGYIILTQTVKATI